MNFLAVGLLIGFYCGFFALLFLQHWLSRKTEQEADIEPPFIPKKPRKVKQHRVSLKPSMRKGGAA